MGGVAIWSGKSNWKFPYCLILTRQAILKKKKKTKVIKKNWKLYKLRVTRRTVQQMSKNTFYC